MNGACAQMLALSENLAHFRAHAPLFVGPHSVYNVISDEDGEESRRLTSLRVILSQARLNSRPSTKLGSMISRRPNMRIGTVIRRPRKERGVISPYPTVVIAVGNVMIFDLRMNG
jgi:hypothetical protein